MKSANQLISQFGNIRDEYFRNLNADSTYKLKSRANMEKASKILARYLSNISNHFGMAYGFDTWKIIGDKQISKEIYTSTNK